MTTETTFSPDCTPEELREFVEKHCLDKSCDSCHDSACRYSSHLNGCTHPLHPKNHRDLGFVICPICNNGKGPVGGRPKRHSRDELRRHLATFHRRLDIDDLMAVAEDATTKYAAIFSRPQAGWAVAVEALTAIDSGFTGTEDEDTLTVEHDGELVARYSRAVAMPVLIADARQHMAEHHGVRLPYSVPAASLGGA